MNVDCELNFNLGRLIKRAGCKDNPLSKILPYINFEKKRILTKSFIKSGFSYCLFVFHRSPIINKIK